LSLLLEIERAKTQEIKKRRQLSEEKLAHYNALQAELTAKAKYTKVTTIIFLVPIEED
jgi:hypothetical protein